MRNAERKRLKTKRLEERQLASLKKSTSNAQWRYYFLFLLVMIALVNIIDEITSNLSVSVQSSFVTEFFVNKPFLGKTYTFDRACRCIRLSACSATFSGR